MIEREILVLFVKISSLKLSQIKGVIDEDYICINFIFFNFFVVCNLVVVDQDV